MLMAKRITWLVVLLLWSTLAGKAEAKEITVHLTVPDPSWTLTIEEVYEMGNELWVLATLSHDSEELTAQVISTIEDSLNLEVPDVPIRYFIQGKDWAWENSEPYTFIEDRKTIEKELKHGKLLYRLEN